MNRWLFALALAFVVGCGPVGEDATLPNPSHALPPVAMANVPIEIRDAAKAQRKDVKFGGCFRTPAGGYQFRGRDKKGRGVAIDVSADGVVLAEREY